MPGAISPKPEPTHWPHGVQLVLAFLLGVAVTIIAVRFLPVFQRSRPTQQIAEGVDLNRADKADLMQLPHVSEKRAEAIMAERERRGGFAQPGDLRGVEGIGPKRERELTPHLRVRGDEQWLKTGGDAPPAAKYGPKEPPSAAVDINRADVEQLKTLPGIGPVLAARIVAERGNGPFKSVDDLRRVPGIGVKTLEKLRPYVKVD